MVKRFTSPAVVVPHILKPLSRGVLLFFLILLASCSTQKVNRKVREASDSVIIIRQDKRWKERIMQYAGDKNIESRELYFSPPDSAGRQHIQKVTSLSLHEKKKREEQYVLSTESHLTEQSTGKMRTEETKESTPLPPNKRRPLLSRILLFLLHAGIIVYLFRRG